jgi:hypothetical protein
MKPVNPWQKTTPLFYTFSIAFQEEILGVAFVPR